MTLWKIKYTTRARKTLDELDHVAKERIEKYITDICKKSNPRIKGRGLTGSRAGQWLYRVGDYRVICEIQDGFFIVLVLEIGHRSDVYKK